MARIYNIKLTEKAFERLKMYIQDTADYEMETAEDIFDDLFTMHTGEVIKYDWEVIENESKSKK